MARKVVSKDELPKQLHRWAVDEMHFRAPAGHLNKALPSERDFSAICKASTIDIWDFIVKNIYSAKTVRKVKGNLLLKQRQGLPQNATYRVKYGSGEHYSQQRAELLDRHRNLVSQITSVRSNISHLEKDLKQTYSELITSENAYREEFKNIQDIERKTAILSANSQHIDEEAAKLNEYKDRLTARVQKIKSTAGQDNTDEKFYSKRGGSSSSEPGSAALESACTKEVRECCESIGGFLHKLLQGHFGKDKVAMSQHKDTLWTSVQSVLDAHSVSQLVVSLAINAQDTAFTIRDKTSNIDIKKDASQLRFKYETTGHLSDLSQPTSLLHSVHQLLEESQHNLIDCFLETEKARNNKHRLEPRMIRAQEMLEDSLQQTYRNQDKGTLQLAGNLFTTELQIAVNRASIRMLENVASSLKEKITVSLRNKEALYGKYQKIQDFKKLADSKQSLIRVLVKQNLNARTRLDEQQRDIIKYIGRAFSSQDATTQSLVLDMRDCVTEEVEALTALSMPHLMFTMLDSAYKLAVMDLSINRLTTQQNTVGGQEIQRLLHALEFPRYMAPELLLPKVVEIEHEIYDLEYILKHHRTKSHCEEENTLVSKLGSLCREIGEHDAKQQERVLPVLHKRLVRVTQALTDCLQVKDSVQAWWEQPAQRTVTWVKVDDNTLQQWRDKWTVVVTRLRQLQLS